MDITSQTPPTDQQPEANQTTPAPHQSLTGGPVFTPQPLPTAAEPEAQSSPPAVESPALAQTLTAPPAPPVPSPVAPPAAVSPSVAAAELPPSNDISNAKTLNTNIVQKPSPIPEKAQDTEQDTTSHNAPEQTVHAQSQPPPLNVNPAAVAIDHAKLEVGRNHPTVKQHNKSHFIIASIVSVVLIMIGIGGVILFTKKNSGQSAQWFGSPQKRQADQSLDPQSDPDTGLPKDFMALNRPCFSLGVPKSSKVSAEQDCLLMATNEVSNSLNIAVTPSTQKNAGLNDLVAKAQKSFVSSGNSTATETDINLAGSAAKKITLNAAGNSASQMRIFVLSPSPSYQQAGAIITSFEISFIYQSEADKKVVDAVLATWSWK